MLLCMWICCDDLALPFHGTEGAITIFNYSKKRKFMIIYLSLKTVVSQWGEVSILLYTTRTESQRS